MIFKQLVTSEAQKLLDFFGLLYKLVACTKKSVQAFEEKIQRKYGEAEELMKCSSAHHFTSKVVRGSCRRVTSQNSAEKHRQRSTSVYTFRRISTISVDQACRNGDHAGYGYYFSTLVFSLCMRSSELEISALS